MDPSDPPVEALTANVMPYAPVQADGRSLARFIQTATLAGTSFPFIFAFHFVAVYVQNIGSTCGTSQANAESAVWLFAGAAIVESLFARSYAKHARLPAVEIRLVSLCMVANLLCLLTPTLLEFRAEYWPH